MYCVDVGWVVVAEDWVAIKAAMSPSDIGPTYWQPEASIDNRKTNHLQLYRTISWTSTH